MSEERWVYVNKAGKLILHIENDGATYLRHGAEAVEQEVTLDYLKQRYPNQYRKAVQLRGESG